MHHRNTYLSGSVVVRLTSILKLSATDARLEFLVASSSAFSALISAASCGDVLAILLFNE